MWTHFWDMHSGGNQKLAWGHIYIEAPEEEAKKVFFARFGRNPEKVTCTCCGADYSISEGEFLTQLTGHHRGCRAIEVKQNPKTGRYLNDDPVIKAHLYLEEGEQPPKGYKVDESLRSLRKEYLTLEEYLAKDDVLTIRADEIKPKERNADIPEQGYVWVD